jgi:hypothetical protein
MTVAQFLSMAEDVVRASLAQAGVQILAEDDPRRDEILADALGQDSLEDRLTVDIVPPEAGQENAGMGAWHIREQAEAHSVLTGRGLVEFITPDGVVPVIVESGDIMVVRRTEHRYLPLTDQRWILRWSGGPDAIFESTDTGRESAAWSQVP